MCARESGVLSYPLRLPDELQPPTIHLLTEALSHMQQVVNDLWERLDEVGQIRGRHVWKQLEDWLPRPEGLPSRVWRCALEGAGRTLRSQAHRKQLFDLLLPLFSGEELLPETARLVGLAYQVRDQIEGERNKVGYLLNLLEQVARFHAQNERLPQDYFELQSPPVLKTAQLPLAADDGPDKGQVYRMELGQGQVALRLKLPGEEGWHWTETVTFPLPEVVEPTQTRAPTLRLKEVKGGETIAVLDFVVEDQARQKNPGGDHVLAFDWGVRRLLSLTILSREGEQLTPPFFVDIGGLAGKQARLRQQIDQLKAKKARLRRRERKQVQAEIKACWRKYQAINEALAHFAANLLLLLALLYDCGLIAGEWLKTLKVSRKKGGNHRQVRTLNWQVSTTIREAIWRKLEYKAARYAIRTKRVWPRDSSHECPRCGGPGVTCKSPEHRQQVSPYGHWFFCSHPACGYNGDRDYVASLNVGRRALIEGYSSDEQDERKPQPVSYRGTGTVLPFPSSESFRAMIERGASSGQERGIRQSPGPNSEAESLLEEGRFCQSLCQRLWTVLSGFNQAIKVGPMWLPGYG